MDKDFETCPHCVAANKAGNIVRMETRTPLISRSDGDTYHLYLFSGPDPWHAKSGGIAAGRAASSYFYTSEQLGIDRGAVTVVFRTIGLDERGVEEAMRDAADQMAAILSSGCCLAHELYYDRGHLSVLRHK